MRDAKPSLLIMQEMHFLPMRQIAWAGAEAGEACMKKPSWYPVAERTLERFFVVLTYCNRVYFRIIIRGVQAGRSFAVRFYEDAAGH